MVNFNFYNNFKHYHQQASHSKNWNFANNILRLLLMVEFDLYVINQGLPVNFSHAELPDVSQKSTSISGW